MSDIAPTSSIASLAAYDMADRTSRSTAASAPAAPSRGTDHVELSTVAKMLGRLSEGGNIRQDLVDRIRGEIASETYETSDKLEATVTGLADELG
ncbi:MAG: hypothetical protein V3V20_05770 [Algisphaera sp.]